MKDSLRRRGVHFDSRETMRKRTAIKQNDNYSMLIEKGKKGYIVKMRKAKILREFGAKVRDFRAQKGLTQEALAAKAGLHRTYIGMIERAEKNITLQNIAKIAAALDRRVADFFS